MNSEKNILSFNLPYNQSSHYWLAVLNVNEYFSGDNSALYERMAEYGMQKIQDSDNVYCICLPNQWEENWKQCYQLIREYDVTGLVEVSLLPGDQQPALADFIYTRKSLAAIENIAQSLWLGRAMLGDAVICYMQPVMDRRNKIFGYESFARIETPEMPIRGDSIIEASRNLNAEYMLDRYLHLKAISTFVEGNLEGFLFINLISGFIHRPEKYLEGLADSARTHGMVAKHIALDFTHSEIPKDTSQLQSILSYCRSQGYLLSLDDISSPTIAGKILEVVKPDFVKLDIKLVREAGHYETQTIIRDLVKMAHKTGATVIAEGVETQEIHEVLLGADVDLFQGYLFSPPKAVVKTK